MTENAMEIKTSPLSMSTPIGDKCETKEINGNNVKTVDLASLERLPIFPVCSMGRIMSNVYRVRLMSTETSLRKIEPKPYNVEVKPPQQSEVVKKKKKIRKEKAVRILGSNPTKRGVRLCFTCKGQIGYRSKKCKHCLNALSKERLEDVAAIQPIIDKNDVEEKENILNRELSTQTDTDLITCSKDETNNDTADHHCQLIKESDDYDEEILQNNDDLQCVVGGTPSDEDVCHKSPENTTKNELIREDIDENEIQVEEEVNEVTTVNIGCKRKQREEKSEGKKQRTVPGFILQFVRIEPKPCVKKPTKKNKEQTTNKQKTDSKRFLSSNATRRGIMSCPLCQKDVGCRSKYCKYCKVAMFHGKERALDYNNLLIVQLSPMTLPNFAVFSVKKTATPSEERCFIKQKTHYEGMSKNNEDYWSCDCNHEETTTCLHVTFFVRNPKIIQARTAMLTEQAIDYLPIDDSFKDKLKILWEKNQTNELPLVQQVALNTLVVMEPVTTTPCKDEDDDTSIKPNETSCVHIRFEKVIRHSLVQPHIFCSGKSCSFWSMSVANGKEPPITCFHYCISLWAIASDNKLDEYFKIFLEAPQVYLHSEVFETVINS